MALLTFGPRASASEINAAIRKADLAPNEKLLVKLTAGTFYLDSAIKILRDNVSLLGAGADKTILKVAASKGNAEAVVVDGNYGDSYTTLSAAAKVDAATFTLKSVKGIKVGSVIKIEEPNTYSYFKQTDNLHLDWREQNEKGNYLREMLTKVTKIEGNKITVDLKSPYAFDTTARVSVPEMRKNVEIGGLQVTTDLKGTPDTYDMTNHYDAFDLPEEGNAAIRVFAAEGLSLHDIVTRNTGSTAFNLSNIYGAVVKDLDVDGAFNKGGDGNGYAYNIKTAFKNVFDNLTDKNMRDSFIVGSFTAEHYNTVHIISTNRSLNFHGSPDSRNTILVDKMILDFLPSQAQDPAVGVGNRLIHPKSTIEDNDIFFKFVWGSNAMDVVHAAASGAEMRTFEGSDTLYGGKSGDLLDPGSQPDMLEGGGGSDTFVFHRNYDQDTIKDFQSGSRGDILDLSGTGITSRAGLSARQVGRDTVLGLGGGDKLTLTGVDASDFAAMRIKFSAPVTKGVSLGGLGLDTGFSGTAGKDTFSLLTTYLDQPLDFLGMKGRDTLKFTAGATFDSATVGRALGIDVVDLSSAKNKAKVTIDNAFAAQADNHGVVVKFNKLGLFLTTKGISDWEAVKVSGTAEIKTAASGAAFSSAGSAIEVAGGNGDDRIKGAGAADSIDGGRGDDRIMGGGGADDLWGGTGDDVFVFASILDSGKAKSSWDVVHDFNTKYDLLDLSLIDAEADKRNDQALRFVSEFAKAKSGMPDGQVKLVEKSGNVDVYVDKNGDSKVDMIIHLEDVVGTLTKADFIL